jgi:type IV pilus assembly protein PilA
MKNTQKGFTLIELLVVIAIIGILSSIVIASLNSARTKGAVSAAKSGAAQLRTQSEVYYDGLGAGTGYATSSTCAISANGTTASGTATTLGPTGCLFGDTTVQSQMKQMGANTATVVIGNVSADFQKWAVSTTLKGSGNIYYCVDNSGNTKEQAASAGAVATAGICA